MNVNPDREFVCYRCKDKTNKVKFKDSVVEPYETSKSKGNRYFHKECYEEYKTSKEERFELDKLCEYIKFEILGLSKNMNIPKRLVDRLMGLRSGQFAPRRNSKVNGVKGGYSYEVILKTVKYKKLDLLIALKDESKFKNESHKIDYLMVIIQNNVHDVYWKLKQKKESDDRLEKLSIEYNADDEFVNKTNIKNNKVSNKLSHLW